MTDRPVIEERENGPLLVKNATRLVGADGTEHEVKAVMALCRCGGSSNKPFCDGSHKENGFESRGGTASGKDKIYSFPGTGMTVLYNPRVCSHAAECVRLAPGSFDPGRKPWIDPDTDGAEAVQTAVRSCPSGALRIDGQDHALPVRAEITVQKDGPYWVLGVEVPADLPGEGATRDKLVLCRCGLSGNKPYCDGSHRDRGWSDGTG